MKKMVKSRWALGMAAAAALALSTGVAAQTKVNVALASAGYLYISVMTADAMGYFKDEKIEANVFNATSGTKAMSALASGDAQFSVTAPPSGFRAREKGVDIQTVGAAITQYASNIVISKKWADQQKVNSSSPTDQKIRALRGITFGVSTPGSGTDQIIRYLARRGGLNPDKDMTIATMQTGGAMLPALARGQIDGFSFSPPVPDEAMRQFGAVMLFELSRGTVKELDGFLYQGVLVRESWAQKNQDTVVRFLKAMQRGLDMIHGSQHTRVRDAVHGKWFKNTDKPFFDQIWEAMRPSYPATVEINTTQMKRVAEFLTDLGDPIPSDALRSGWTNEYAARAVVAARPAKPASAQKPAQKK